MFSGVTDVEKSPTSPDFEAAIQPTKNKWSPVSDEFDFGLDEAKPEVKEALKDVCCAFTIITQRALQDYLGYNFTINNK